MPRVVAVINALGMDAVAVALVHGGPITAVLMVVAVVLESFMFATEHRRLPLVQTMERAIRVQHLLLHPHTHT